MTNDTTQDTIYAPVRRSDGDGPREKLPDAPGGELDLLMIGHQQADDEALS